MPKWKRPLSKSTLCKRSPHKLIRYIPLLLGFYVCCCNGAYRVTVEISGTIWIYENPRDLSLRQNIDFVSAKRGLAGIVAMSSYCGK